MELHRQVLASTERAADAGEMDPDLLRPQAEARRDLITVDMEPLRRDVDVHPAFAVGNGEARLGPEERLVLDADLVHPGDGHVSLRVRIAVPNYERTHDVRARVVAISVAHRGTPWMQGLLLGGALGVDDRFERLVLHADLLRRTTRLFGMLGGDERDRLPEVADAVDREHRLVAELEAVQLLARDILVGEHRMHAGHRQGARDVDPVDTRVRVRAADGLSPQHSRRVEVARVRELARDFRNGIRSPRDLADPPEDDLPRGSAHRDAASLTASKIFV